MCRSIGAIARSLVLLATLLPSACGKSETPAATREAATTPGAKADPAAAAPARDAPESARPREVPAGHPPIGSASSAGLTGIAFEVPQDWIVEPVQPQPMGPKAVYRLPKAEGDDEDASVRITHFPGMKGKDDLNIDRWVSQIRRPDGSASSRTDARITVHELGDVHLTIVDISGSVVAGMATDGPAKAGQRLIAAIVDHAEGPHYIKASGGAATMEKWAASVDAFLKSAKTK